MKRNPLRTVTVLLVGAPIALALASLPLIVTALLVHYGGVLGCLALPLGGILGTASLLILASAATFLRNLIRPGSGRYPWE